MEKNLHIVCHEIPWPVKHGGHIDLFYKIESLFHAGVKIHLHCFYKQSSDLFELKKYCSSINIYKRRKFSFSFFTPYIVSSRKDKNLFKNLCKDEYPILFEGIHTTFYLRNLLRSKRKIAVRLHNTEHIYYKNLSENEAGFLKKFYFRFESFLLKKYEKKLPSDATYFAVSKRDIENFDVKSILFLPVFIANQKIQSQTGTGKFCLYHGNLSVNENECAVKWLAEKVFRNNDVKFVVAGLNPSNKLKSYLKQFSNVELIENPSGDEMTELIKTAQINLIYSFNTTGVKLKLINSFIYGRFCVANTNAAEGSGLEEFCRIANSSSEFKAIINEFINVEFSENEILRRKKITEKIYNNSVNSSTIIKLLF